MGARIGENVCLYPNGGDPMMTEPDMVTIGSNSCIDNASLIAHINTRGVFRSLSDSAIPLTPPPFPSPVVDSTLSWWARTAS
jgi:hypothetical protein